MLVRLVYASRSTQPITPELLGDILTKSRKNNAESGITGVLCVCHGDVYLQALEGGREQVNTLYTKLLADSRHTDVVLLDYAEIRQRRFASWRMGQANLDKLNPAVALKYSETAVVDPYSIPGSVALELLEELMSTAAIVGGSQ